MNPLNGLIALHEANERLKEIHELKGDLPEVLTQKKIELDDINKNEKTNQSQLKLFNSKITSIQTTLTDSKTKLDKYNDQIFNVTKTKEYEALILETDQLKESISNLTQELSDSTISKDELEKEIELSKELKGTLATSIEENQKLLSDQMADTDKEEQVLTKSKEQTIKKVESKYLDVYTKLFNKYGQGMAIILRKSCNHCYAQLPPQLIVEIEYDKKIITCPSCDVFLYYTNKED